MVLGGYQAIGSFLGHPLLIVYFEKIRVFKAGAKQTLSRRWIRQHGIMEYDFGLVSLVSLG